MILTDYYKMVKLLNGKSELRFDCVASTGDYEPFEAYTNRPRAKTPWLFLYYTGVPNQFSADAKRKADKSITTPDGKNLSSVYTSDPNNPLFGYGDTVNTNDALLFLFNEDYTQMEIFVARGLKNHIKGLFFMLGNGELDDKMECLRQRAKRTNAPDAESFLL